MWGKGAGWAGRNYLKFLMPISIVLLLWVLAFYAWRLLPITAGLLDRMGRLDTAGNAEAARNIAFAIAAFAGMLAVLATVPFRLVRAWIAERTARVAESNLTTDLINKAVEGLGAEKTLSRIGRPVRYPAPDDSIHTEIQWEGDNPPDYPREELGDWQTFNKTEPSLEIRIGAIYTLERIARENPGEHVRVMEILCAYIRENAPARDARPNPLDRFPDYPETPTAEDLAERERMRDDRRNRLGEWTADLRPNHALRTDIQTALEVIGRRSEDQIAREGKSDTGGEWTGYRLDLRGADLQAADLADRPDRPMRFGHARLDRARMQGAVLRGADLRPAEWARGDTGEPAHSAVLRGAVGLTQDQHDQMIGNSETLLPETLDDGSVPSIPSCWTTPPPFFEAMVARQSFGIDDLANDLRAQYLCPDGAEPARTGTPLALDAPYPDGHTLADREE
jgi:hypothetical protein